MALVRPRVLIVEDDPDLLVMMKVNLASAGLDTIVAGDGGTAIARIETEHPDAIVLDVMLPGVDGWQVLEQLQAMGNRVPVVVCSTKMRTEERERADALGAVGYVVKPFDVRRLIDTVLAAVAGPRPAWGRAVEPSLGTEGLEPA
jgi:DNA-binding response OmpR family regulator